MEKILAFKIFCLENYKAAHNLSGNAALEIFQKYQLFDYINDFYDILHSYGRLYLINNFDEYIAHHNDTPGSL